jgi:hypothetical protein
LQRPTVTSSFSFTKNRSINNNPNLKIYAMLIKQGRTKLAMRKLTFILVFIISSFYLTISFAGTCGGQTPCPRKSCADDICCARMGGVSYCDSSAGRLVCNNGYFSSCYCSHHAVMDLQLLEGCCLWQGGVASTDISEECSLHNRSTFGGIW